MPAHIHPSVVLTPSYEDGEYEDPPSIESGERIATVTELLNRAQIAALLVTFDKKRISPEPEFGDIIQKLTATFFPGHFDVGKLERKFRLLGQTLLDRRRALDLQHEPPVWVSNEELDRYIATRPPGPFGKWLHDHFPQALSLEDIHRWGDVYHHLDDHCRHLQFIGRQAARADLGLPSDEQFPDEEDRQNLARAMTHQHEDALDALENWDFLSNYDRVVIGGVTRERQGIGAWASQRNNVIKLYPAFFALAKQIEDEWEIEGSQWSDARIEHLMPQALKTIIHEFFHTKALGATRDVKLNNAALYDVLHETPPVEDYDPENRVWCTTNGSDMLLTAIDNFKGTNHCEDNADSWARFAWFYMAIVAYPEFDFLSSTTIKRRETLLHHCSLLDCLRIRCAGSIRELPGYDDSKDSFSLVLDNQSPWNSAAKILSTLLSLTNAKDHLKSARRLREILNELDVRAYNDPPRDSEGSTEGEESNPGQGSGVRENENETSAPTEAVEELRLNSLQEAFLREELEFGLLRTTSDEEI